MKNDQLLGLIVTTLSRLLAGATYTLAAWVVLWLLGKPW